MTEHNAPNGTIYFHNAALSRPANSIGERGTQEGTNEKEKENEGH